MNVVVDADFNSISSNYHASAFVLLRLFMSIGHKLIHNIYFLLSYISFSLFMLLEHKNLLRFYHYCVPNFT